MPIPRAIIPLVPIVGVCISAPAKAHPTFDLTFTSSVGTQARNATIEAAANWSAVLADNVTIKLTIGFSSLSSGVVASTTAAEPLFTVSAVRAAMVADAKSSNDATGVSHIPNVSALPLYINYTSTNPNGAGSPIPYVDSTGADNTNIRMTNANAMALGLTPVAQRPGISATNCDGSIIFSNTASYDYDRADGIGSSSYDFVGLAMHEIGHTLGFISGVDFLDTNSTSPNFYPHTLFVHVTPIDLFRCTAASVAAGAALDYTAGPATKNFSLDNCDTILGTFSTGVVHGDGYQASHWQNGLGLGIMDPTIARGELLAVTTLDLTALDVMGWDLSAQVGSFTDIPEPNALLLSALGLLGLAAARVRRVAADQ